MRSARTLQQRWLLAWLGGAWLGLTVVFEFSFGRLVAGKPWRELTGDYDIPNTRLWSLVLAWIELGPEGTGRWVDR